MKKVMFLAVMAMLSISLISAQDNLSFNKVIQVDSTKKDIIYTGIKQWLSMNFVSSKKVIDLDDKDAGLIIVNALTDYNYGKLSYLAYNGYLKYTIKIQIKDNRYKVDVTNFTHEVNDSPAYWNLGLITNSDEYPNKTSFMNKGSFNKVWIDLKLKAAKLSNDFFSKLESIKFYSTKNNDKNNNW